MLRIAGSFLWKLFKKCQLYWQFLLSLPARGAWIEMAARWGLPGQRKRSLPARGAWIEIWKLTQREASIPSLPARGAWIEIFR